jgi:hypothetical protein
VQVDYLADDAQPKTVNRFLEVYLLWLFGFVMFCSSQGDVVLRFLILYARRIADALLDAVPRSIGLCCSSQHIQGAVHGGC